MAGTGLGTVDIILLVLSLLASLGIGVYHAIKGIKATPAEYMVGSRAMAPLPLAMSLMVGTISAVTIMGNAGEVYVYGTQIWMMDLGMVLGMLLVAEVFIPIFYPLNMISLYKYIEERFNSKILRKSTVILQLAAAYVFMGFLLFTPSKFLEIFTNLPMIANVFIIGVSCTLYSAFGGVKAVVYADVFQLWVMFAGVLAIIIQGCINVGGLGEAWDIAYHRGRIDFFNFDLNPYQRHSFWLTIVFGFFFNLQVFGVTQNQTQRTFSTGSVKDAKRVMYYAAIGLVIMRGLIQLSGLVIFANYAECDPLTANGGDVKTVKVIIVYVMDKLTQIPGLAGIFVASIYAAVLSSVSTQVNSMTALLWEDFLKEINRFKLWDEVKITRLQKCLVIVAGFFGILMSLLASMFSSLLGGLFALAGAISGPMIGLFLVALLLPWVKLKGAICGLLSAVIVSMWLLIGQLVMKQPPEHLPFSHEACPSLAPNITMTETSDRDIHPIYGLSYCLNFCYGTFVCIFVGILVTLCTGSNTPQTVREDLIYPPVWKLFAYRRAPSDDDTKEKISKFLRNKGRSPSPTQLPEYKDDTPPLQKGNSYLASPENTSPV